MKKFDLIIVGSGIIGTFHAYHAARMGKKVLLLEKDNYPVSATVRNFGQVVPSGMAGEWLNFGSRSLKIYQEIQQEFDISVRQNGSVYIASDEDEQQLIHEAKVIFDTKNYQAELLSPKQILAKYPAIKKTYAREAIFFPQEVSVEPNLLIHRLLTFIQQKYSVFYQPNSPVVDCQIKGEEVEILVTGNRQFLGEKVIICSGGEFKLLFPEIFRASGLEVSKLQMMRTIPMPEVTLEGNILTGLSIRRYESFEECPSFQLIKTPEHYVELKKWGIHLLFKKAIDGSIIMGDSHEYADAFQTDDLGFNLNNYVNELMLKEAERIVNFDVRKLTTTWAGFYPQHPEKDIFEMDIENKIHIRTGIGGKGMTSSAGYSEANLTKIYG